MQHNGTDHKIGWHEGMTLISSWICCQITKTCHKCFEWHKRNKTTRRSAVIQARAPNPTLVHTSHKMDTMYCPGVMRLCVDNRMINHIYKDTMRSREDTARFFAATPSDLVSSGLQATNETKSVCCRSVVRTKGWRSSFSTFQMMTVRSLLAVAKYLPSWEYCTYQTCAACHVMCTSKKLLCTRQKWQLCTCQTCVACPFSCEKTKPSRKRPSRENLRYCTLLIFQAFVWKPQVLDLVDVAGIRVKA